GLKSPRRRSGSAGAFPSLNAIRKTYETSFAFASSGAGGTSHFATIPPRTDRSAARRRLSAEQWLANQTGRYPDSRRYISNGGRGHTGPEGSARIEWRL